MFLCDQYYWFVEINCPTWSCARYYVLKMDVVEPWDWDWYFKGMIGVGKVLTEHVQDAEVREVLEPLRHALVTRLDAIQDRYSSRIGTLEYIRNMILTQ